MLHSLLAALVLLAANGARPDEKSRIEKLENSLLAPCCYQEPVRRHMSDTAKAMRAEIAGMVREGKSDREILDYYKARYGARVLVEPEGGRWWVMHLVPVAALLVGAGLVIQMLARWRKAGAAAPPEGRSG